MKKTKRWLSCFVVVVIASLLFTATAYAQNHPFELQANQNSEYVFDKVQLLEYTENSVRFKLVGHRMVGEDPAQIDIEFDPESKTYTAVKTSLPLEQQLDLDALQPEETITSQSTTNYTAKIGIVTRDPAYFPLCRSWLQLSWTVSNNKVTGYTRSKGQWDGQPTLALTYWYCDYHRYTSYAGFDDTSAWAQSQAKHYNWDFGDNNVATYAYHNIIIIGSRSGGYHYECEGSHTGEAAHLLRWSVYFP